MAATMGEFKNGTLRSGSKSGSKVTSRAQAIAIGMNDKKSKKRAKKVKQPKAPKQPAALEGASVPAAWKPPTDHQRLKSSLGYAANDAVMAHPHFKQMKRRVHRDMMQAAKGAGFNGAGVRSYRSA